MDAAIKIFGAFLVAVLTLILSVPLVILSGIIVQDAWGWFIVPLGAEPIGLAHTIGLSMLVGYYKMNAKKVQEKDERPFKTLTIALGMMLLSWGIMALVASFM